MKMNLTNRTAGEKLDGITSAAKRRTARMIDGVRATLSRMANRLSKRLHKAGRQITRAGTKVADAGEKVQELA
jgi:hypothetical protein